MPNRRLGSLLMLLGAPVLLPVLLVGCAAMGLCADFVGTWAQPLQFFAGLALWGIFMAVLAGIVGLIYLCVRPAPQERIPVAMPPITLTETMPYIPSEPIRLRAPLYPSAPALPIPAPVPAKPERAQPVYMPGSKRVAGWQQPDGNIIWKSNRPAS